MITDGSIKSFIKKFLDKAEKYNFDHKISMYIVPMESIKHRSVFGKVKVEDNEIVEPTETQI